VTHNPLNQGVPSGNPQTGDTQSIIPRGSGGNSKPGDTQSIIIRGSLGNSLTRRYTFNE